MNRRRVARVIAIFLAIMSALLIVEQRDFILYGPIEVRAQISQAQVQRRSHRWRDAEFQRVIVDGVEVFPWVEVSTFGFELLKIGANDPRVHHWNIVVHWERQYRLGLLERDAGLTWDEEVARAMIAAIRSR